MVRQTSLLVIKIRDLLTTSLHICPNNGIDPLLLLRWEILFVQEGLRSE